MILYNIHGKKKKTNQTDIRYLNAEGHLFYIKNDGSIISKIDSNTYEGKIIGKIPGAVNGCIKDISVIVTDKGELYFRGNENSDFIFNDTTEINGWTRIDDVKDVVKASVCGDSFSQLIIVLNKKGEVYCCSNNQVIVNKSLTKMSDQNVIVDLSGTTKGCIFLDNQGNLYEYGDSIQDKVWSFKDHMTQIDSAKNVVQFSANCDRGAALTQDKEVYAWDLQSKTKGKAVYFIVRFGKYPNQGWEKVIMAPLRNIYLIKDGQARRVPLKEFCDEVDHWN